MKPISEELNQEPDVRDLTPAHGRPWRAALARFVFACGFVALGLFSGCTSLIGVSQHRVDSNDQVTVLNAKERLLQRSATFEVDKDGKTQASASLRRVCAEPAPDVFSVAASSLGLDGEVGKKSPAEITLGLKFASSFSEQAAAIARSQTINILREVMYRTCERYLSGALNKEEFIIQAYRDQQLIVQVLAIEQLTHAYQAQAIALQTSAMASSSGVTELSIKTLADVHEAVSAATSAAKKARDEAERQAPAGACSAKPLDPDKPPEGVKADAVKKKNELCDKAKEASTKQAAAESHYEAVRAAVEKQGARSAQAGGEGKNLTPGAGGGSTEAVADAVLKIVNRTPVLSEFDLTCVVYYRKLLDPNVSGNGNDLAKACKGLIKSNLELQEIRNEKESCDIQRTLGDMDCEAKKIWEPLSTPGAAQDRAFESLKSRGSAISIEELKSNLESLSLFIRYYGSLIRREQQDLLKAAQQVQ